MHLNIYMCVYKCIYIHIRIWDFRLGSAVKECACNAGDAGDTQVQSLGGEDLLEEGMATHSSILAWRITCMEEAGRL